MTLLLGEKKGKEINVLSYIFTLPADNDYYNNDSILAVYNFLNKGETNEKYFRSGNISTVYRLDFRNTNCASIKVVYIKEIRMSRTIKIDWSVQTEENKKILLILGFKPAKKVVKKRDKAKQTVTLRDKGIPIQIRRNIFCYCCGSTTTEFVTSYVPKELVSKDREAITDSVRTCKKCTGVLNTKSKADLINIVLHAYRTYTY